MTGAVPVEIRPARPDDADGLARLRWEFRAALAPPAEAEAKFVARCAGWMALRIRDGSLWRSWVALDAGTLVGTVWVAFLEKLPNPVAEPERHAYVSNLFVRPSARGRGLGSRLLGAALAACDAAGVDAVILWPTPRSRSLYERHGFGVSGDLLERRGSARI